MLNEIQKAQSARILATYGETSESILEKSGEGSKGGKIIGHTKSGKPIYEHSIHTSKDFTAEDHSDATSAHMKAAKSANEKKQFLHPKENAGEMEKLRNQSQHHSSMAELHSNAINQKYDEKKD